MGAKVPTPVGPLSIDRICQSLCQSLCLPGILSQKYNSTAGRGSQYKFLQIIVLSWNAHYSE